MATILSKQYNIDVDDVIRIGGTDIKAINKQVLLDPKTTNIKFKNDGITKIDADSINYSLNALKNSVVNADNAKQFIQLIGESFRDMSAKMDETSKSKIIYMDDKINLENVDDEHAAYFATQQAMQATAREIINQIQPDFKEKIDFANSTQKYLKRKGAIDKYGQTNTIL